MTKNKLFVAACIVFLLAVPTIVPVLASNVLSAEENSTVTIKLFHAKTNKIEEMDLEEYIKGVVAKDFKDGINIETLKTHAVLARTFALSRLKDFGGNGCQCNNHMAYHDICSEEHCQLWLSMDEQLKLWGTAEYEEYWNTITTAVNLTKGEVLKYKGDLIRNINYEATVFSFNESNSDMVKTRADFNSLADMGNDYKEILSYYFPEAEVSK